MNKAITQMQRGTTLSASALLLGSVAFLPSVALAQESADRSVETAEIIVTAQKREERLKDVPVPITAVGGEALLAENKTRAQDFFSSVPGINLQFLSNRAQLAIRGITTGPVTGNPTVGYTIDDVPYGSSTGQGGLFGSAPDLDPSELARIEVLRGPQGTLYGASSIGGLVKYITVDPQLDAISGAIGGGVLMVKHGGNTLGYNAMGSVNVPLSETLAVRASAFTREDPGYIDNVFTGKSDVNSSKVTGGRLSMLWKPSDGFSLKLGSMLQVRNTYGSSNVDITTGSRNQQTDIGNTGRARAKNQLHSAVATADLGEIELTSVSAFSRSQNFDALDFTAQGFTGFMTLVFPDAPPFGSLLRQGYDVDKYSQELRLAGGIGDNIDWIVGGFYTKEDAEYTIDIDATDLTTNVSYGRALAWRDSLGYKEWAAFGNATVRFSDRFDVQFGGRYSENRQRLTHRTRDLLPDFDEDGNFIPTPNPTLFISETDVRAKGQAFTYQISPRFKPTPDHMIYGRIASGYRPGGTNANCNPTSSPPVPCQFKPDKTVNYELGAKGDLAGRTLSYDVSLFLIDWKDIQVTQVIEALGGLTFNGNGGKARSRGFELSLEARPAAGLTLKAWGAYTDATLRDAFTAATVFAAAGERLPYTSKWSGRFSIDYAAPLSDSVTGNIGAALTYVGDRRGEFVASEAEVNLRQVYPEYVTLDLNAGLEIENIRFSLFVQNATNKRGLIGGGYYNQTSFNNNWFNFTAPRTIGLNIEYSF